MGAVHQMKARFYGGSENSFGISLAAVPVDMMPYDVENCVATECQVEVGEGNGGVGVRMISKSSGKMHIGCVLRQSLIDLGGGGAGVVAGGCLGTVIEENRIQNCATGAQAQEDASSDDLILRQNSFYSVEIGIGGDLSSGTTIGRLVILQNSIEWVPSADPEDPVTGVKTSGSGDFLLLVVRQNLMRRVDGEAATIGQKGVDLPSLTQGIVEENNIDVSALDNGIRFAQGEMRTFNNRTPGGDLVRGLNTVHGTYVNEVMTDAENYVFGL